MDGFIDGMSPKLWGMVIALSLDRLRKISLLDLFVPGDLIKFRV